MKRLQKRHVATGVLYYFSTPLSLFQESELEESR
jgi:hypothetical protein